MQISASGVRSRSNDEATNDAASSTAPAAVIHDRSGWGERKKLIAESEVWLSSTSANHSCHWGQRSSIRSSPLIFLYRSIILPTDGGDPARASSSATAASRRWNELYMVGRYEISRASRPKPMPASLNMSMVRVNPWGMSNPRVSSDEP